MSSKNKIYYWILIFMIGCFVGWIYEEIFYLVVDHKLINSGFLYGPYLPVYGWGAVFLNLLLKRFKKYPMLVFLLSILITGVLEYITGDIMFKIYNRTWWDYTGLFLNIGGYVCLRSVLSFSVGAMFLIYFIEPKLCSFLENSKVIKKYVSILFVMVFLIDNIVTFLYRY